jgi:hypothetical protein
MTSTCTDTEPPYDPAGPSAAWAVNGVLVAVYHLHMPWAIPTALLDTARCPTRRAGTAAR